MSGRRIMLNDLWTSPDGGKALVVGWHAADRDAEVQVEMIVTVPAGALLDPDRGWTPPGEPEGGVAP